MRNLFISICIIYLICNSICFADISVTNNFQQFVTDTKSIMTVSFPETTDFSTIPYTENGVSISQANGFENQVVDSEQLDITNLTGNVLRVNGPEHFNIKISKPAFSIGLFLIDGYWSYDSCPQSDSKFSVLIKNHKTIIGSIDVVDPPLKSNFFIGITTNAIFDSVEIREIGAPIDENAGDHCENDFIGIIYLKYADQSSCFDSDKDGVIDQWDYCPETPINSAVNSDGCHIIKGDLSNNGKVDIEDSIKILQLLTFDEPQVFKSCKDILEHNKNAKDGVYTIDTDGKGEIDEFEVYCDMTTDGGGWTRCGWIDESLANDTYLVINESFEYITHSQLNNASFCGKWYT